MAYRVGDMDTYDYACYLFARELAHLYAQQAGASYFRRHQPWHSMEFMDEDVYLTGLEAELAGWQVEGANASRPGTSGPLERRWLHFQNEDLARFFRDYRTNEVSRELGVLHQRLTSEPKPSADGQTGLREQELRSLLLNEIPGAPTGAAGDRTFEVIASCLSSLRVSHPTRLERLIPSGAPTPFVAGLERDVAGPNPYLGQALRNSAGAQPMWPEVSWGHGWKTPTGHPWSLGHVTPGGGAAPASVRVLALNWNTEAFLYSLRD
jgi:hypothetical protein